MPKPVRVNTVPTRPVNRGSARFALFVRHVQGCRACPRMEGRKRVLTELNGPVKPISGVMFIAEAPGRNGADRTGIPLHGDPTGINFEMLLASVEWSRADVFITNCVLCNPRDESGNNDTPTDAELENCSFNLEQTIRFVDPSVVVTLGAKALAGLNLIEQHEYSLSGSVARPCRWNGRTLFPLYHPSPRVLGMRSLAQMMKDFRQLKEVADAAAPW